MADAGEGFAGGLDTRSLEAAFHLSSEPSAFLSEDGRILVANLALARLAVKEAHDLEGHAFAELFDRGDQGQIGSFLQAVRAWSEAREERPRVVQGSMVPVYATGRVFVTSGGKRYLQVTLQDARERQRAEQLHLATMAAGRTANAAATLPELARGLLGVIRSAIPAAAGVVVYAYDPHDDTLAALAHHGVDEAWLARRGRQPLRGESVVADAARRRESAFIVDRAIEVPAHEPSLPQSAGSILLLPVGADELLGALLVHSAPQVRLDLDDLRCLEVIGSEMASAARRIAASSRLLALEREYAALIERARDGIVVLDAQGRVLGMNTRAADLLGPAGPGAPLRDLLGPAGGAPSRLADELLAEILSRGQATVFRAVAAGGKARRVRLHATLADTAPRRIVMFAEDATQEVRARRLQDLTASFHAWLVDHAPGPADLGALTARAAEAAEACGAACLVDGLTPRLAAAQGRLPAARLLHEAAARVDGAETPLLLAIPTDEGPVHLTALAADADAGDEGDAGERVVLLLAHAWTDGAPFSEADAPWLRLAREEMERVLRHHHLNEALRRALGREREQHARLRRLHHELQEFTLWTTHDLREPMRSLATLVEMLREEAERLDSRDAQALAGQVASEATLLKRRLHDMHAYSALAQEQGPASDVPLDKLLRSAVAALGPDAARVAATPPFPPVHGHAERLALALRGVLDFALRRAPPATEVRVRARAEKGHVDVTVEDEGPLIPQNAHRMAFRLFARLPDGTDVGVGLPLARRIALQHGGSLRIENEEGRTRFVLRLPQAKREAPARPGDASTPADREPPRRDAATPRPRGTARPPTRREGTTPKRASGPREASPMTPDEKPRAQPANATEPEAPIERKPGGAGPGSTATGSIAPGLGTPQTSPKGDLRHPGGITRPLGETTYPAEREARAERESVSEEEEARGRKTRRG